MSDTSQMSDSEHLKIQIRQMKEAVTTLENQTNGVPSVSPDELWSVIKHNLSPGEPVHPRLQQILHGHVNLEQLKIGLKRLENDLNDVGRSPESMYDGFQHEINLEDAQSGPQSNAERFQEQFQNQGGNVEEKKENDNRNSALIRDANQRPLSAYSSVADEEE